MVAARCARARGGAVRGGSVAYVARPSRVEQEAARGAGLVESGGLVPIVPIYTRFVLHFGENRHVRVS